MTAWKLQVHQPVLTKEVLHFWHRKKGGIYIDATVGTGGHAEALLRRDPKATLLGLDWDPEAIKISMERLMPFGKRVMLINENYVNLPEVLSRLNISKADGVLLDMGASSLQLDSAERGFSFLRNGPLDMRMNPGSGRNAFEIIRDLSVRELGSVIKSFGEESFYKPIASALKNAAASGKLTGTMKCAQIIAHVVLSKKRVVSTGIHPATKTFQALRIAVNRELENIEKFLKNFHFLIPSGARAIFIAFHSLEDRLIKNAIRFWAKGCICPPSFPKCVCGGKPLFKMLTPKPVRAQLSEILLNPRSRSAKMRVVEKI